MVIDTKEKTAICTSVGADERQSVQITNSIIPTSNAEFNDPNENSAESLEEMYRQMQRMSHPYYLHTVSMTELYQTPYKSRPPIIDGLLYGGAYILAGAPKIGKSFWWRKSPTTSARVKSCGNMRCIKALFSISLWKMITSESKAVCS